MCDVWFPVFDNDQTLQLVFGYRNVYYLNFGVRFIIDDSLLFINNAPIKFLLKVLSIILKSSLLSDIKILTSEKPEHETCCFGFTDLYKK